MPQCLAGYDLFHAKQPIKQGENLHNNLILANVYRRGTQKVEFTIKMK